MSGRFGGFCATVIARLRDVSYDEKIQCGTWRAYRLPACLLVQLLKARMRFDQEQHPFEDFLSLDGVMFLKQLTVKLAQSIYVCDDGSSTCFS